MSRLDSLVRAARDAEPSFDAAASLGAVLQKKERRARRERIVKLAVGGLSAATLVIAVMMRVSITPANAEMSFEPQPQPQPQAVAVHAQDDGGFARD